MSLQEEIKKINERIEALNKDMQSLMSELDAGVENDFPQDGDVYWYINPLGFAFHDEWSGFITERHKIEIGNVFKTKEQADFAVEKLKVEAELQKFGRPFKEDEYNYFIQIHPSHNNIVVESDDFYQTQGTIYFESTTIANEATDTVGEERIKKYIFGEEV